MRGFGFASLSFLVVVAALQMPAASKDRLPLAAAREITHMFRMPSGPLAADLA